MKFINKNLNNNIIILTLIFLLSYVPYFLGTDMKYLMVPILTLILFAYFCFTFSSNEIKQNIFNKIFSPSIALYTIALPLIVETTSLFHESNYPANYGLAMILTLISIRVIMCVVSLNDILISYYYASLIFLFIFIPLSYDKLYDSALLYKRFNIFSFHPNTLAFVLSSFIPIYLWIYKRSQKNKLWLFFPISISATIIYFASSRGSIVAILTSFVGIVFLFFAKSTSTNYNQGKLKLKYLVIFIMVVTFLFLFPNIIRSFKNYSIEILDLNNPSRDLISGLSGRVERWEITLKQINKGHLFIGRGYRTGEIDLNFCVDNGYLGMIYEFGLFVTVFIVLKYLLIAVVFVKQYFSSYNRYNNALYLSLVLLMGIFLTNNVVARYLFGIGNPFSLLGLFLFLVTRSDLIRNNARLPVFKSTIYSPYKSQSYKNGI